MDKLIQLLNECKLKSYRVGVNGDNSIYQQETDAHGNVHIIVLPDYKLISKEYGFIKWLVDNDKIDRGKFEVEYTDRQTLKDVYIAGAKQYELIIMILSISDTPIDDLISYLK